MNLPDDHLIVGIGSRHGDDQAGWLVIDALAARDLPLARLNKAAVPHDLLDWLDGCQSLHIVDACDSGHDVQRYDHSVIERASRVCRASNSHQFDVTSTLRLASSLGRLPRQVTLWAIPGKQFEPHGAISHQCMNHVANCADLITSELTQQF